MYKSNNCYRDDDDYIHSNENSYEDKYVRQQSHFHETPWNDEIPDDGEDYDR